MIKQAIAVDTEIFSAQSSSVADDQRELARMLIGMGRYSEAMAPLDSSLAVNAKVHGVKSTEYASILFQVSNLNSSIGRYAAAIDAMRTVYDLRRERMGADDLRTTRAGDTLGSLIVDSGNATAEECCTFSPFSFELDLEPGSYEIVVSESDESGGEGRPPMSDSRSFTVE